MKISEELKDDLKNSRIFETTSEEAPFTALQVSRYGYRAYLLVGGSERVTSNVLNVLKGMGCSVTPAASLGSEALIWEWRVFRQAEALVWIVSSDWIAPVLTSAAEAEVGEAVDGIEPMLADPRSA